MVSFPLMLKILRHWNSININKESILPDFAFSFIKGNYNKFKYYICRGFNINQKFVATIIVGNSIAGFFKFIKKESSNELKMYLFLYSCNVKNIPAIIQYRTGVNFTMLLLGTKPKLKSYRNYRNNNIFCQLHLDFLIDLHNKTKRLILFEDSDYYKKLCNTKSRITMIKSKELINFFVVNFNIIERENIGKYYEYSVHHNDFKSGNMYITEDGLFVFDWETNCYTYPPLLDMYLYLLFQAKFDYDKIMAFGKEIPYFNTKDLIWYILDFIKRLVDNDENTAKYHQVLFENKLEKLVIRLSKN